MDANPDNPDVPTEVASARLYFWIGGYTELFLLGRLRSCLLQRCLQHFERRKVRQSSAFSHTHGSRKAIGRSTCLCHLSRHRHHWSPSNWIRSPRWGRTRGPFFFDAGGRSERLRKHLQNGLVSDRLVWLFRPSSKVVTRSSAFVVVGDRFKTS